MSSKLMIVLTTIGIVGCSVASGALAAPHHRVEEARHFSGSNASAEVNGAAYAVVGEESQSGDGFDSDVSEPRYHGGPKSPY
jgi:hypothetical protein